MCGIAGYVTNCEGGVSSLKQINARLQHRGPDDHGIWIHPTGRVGLVHTRLSILDLSPAAHQPMADGPTGNVIAFNGEIYNHRKVRAEIEKEIGPVSWKSSSDTETLLVAFRVWSIGCLARLRGMFAFAVWEEKVQRLWLIRDRLGIKPLYYHERAGMLEFASEVQALLKGGCLELQLNPVGLRHYARFGCVHDDAPLVQGVRNLRAGHWLCWEKGRSHGEPYWRPEAAPLELSIPEARLQVAREFDRAVQEHLLADVEVSAFLSGGMDSAAVCASAARVLGNRLHSFTVVFPGSDLDEGPEAQATAKVLGTRHHEVHLGQAEVLEGVAGALAAMDLPTIDGINTYLVAGAARKDGLKVALSGLGGDELFGGYRHFWTIPWLLRTAWLWKNLPVGWVERMLRVRLNRRNATERAWALHEAGSDAAEMVNLHRSRWSSPTLDGMGLGAEDVEIDELMRQRDYVTRISWQELTGYLRMMLLRDADVFGMAHGLEIRVPFLDHELVELLLRIPGRVKMSGGGLKPLLAAALRRHLPPRLVGGRKRGFVLPFERWMRNELHDMVEIGLQAAQAEPLLAGVDLRMIRNDFEKGHIHWSRLWQWVVLGHWLKRCR